MTTATFILDCSGKFDLELGYEDLFATTAMQRREKWIENYLAGLRVSY